MQIESRILQHDRKRSYDSWQFGEKAEEEYEGKQAGHENMAVLSFFVCPPYLCACRFSKMFDPISRFVAGSKCFNV